MKDTTVFEGKSLHELLKDIDSLAATRRGTITDIVQGLRTYIINAETAAVFVPMIRDLMDVWIKNDEHLIKMGTIAQRIISADSYQKTGGGDSLADILSADERERLTQEALNDLHAATIDTSVAAAVTQVNASVSGSTP